MKKIDDSTLINKKFNHLTILSYAYNKNKKRYFKCQCDCGKIIYLPLSVVRNGYTKSCGCIKGKHKKSRTRLYNIWIGIKQRCNNKNCTIYKNYGEKGIKICKEWEKDFINFYNWSINNGYKDNLTIDRINNNGNYEPNNCRWATFEQQNTNLKMLKTNTSGYKGLSWSKTEKKWICNISINNKSKRIGSYKTQKEAVYARNKFIEENKLPHQKNIYTGEKVIKNNV